MEELEAEMEGEGDKFGPTPSLLPSASSIIESDPPEKNLPRTSER